MAKKVALARDKRKKFDAIAYEAARIHGKSPRLGLYVRDGLRNNEEMFETIMFLNEGWNLLVKAAEDAVQFRNLQS